MLSPQGEAEDRDRKCLAPESIGSPIRYVVIVIDSRTQRLCLSLKRAASLNVAATPCSSHLGCMTFVTTHGCCAWRQT